MRGTATAPCRDAQHSQTQVSGRPDTLLRCFAPHQVGLYGSSSPLPPGPSLPAAQMAAWLCTASTCCCSCWGQQRRSVGSVRASSPVDAAARMARVHACQQQAKVLPGHARAKRSGIAYLPPAQNRRERSGEPQRQARCTQHAPQARRRHPQRRTRVLRRACAPLNGGAAQPPECRRAPVLRGSTAFSKLQRAC
jgi:hypothetical protein